MNFIKNEIEVWTHWWKQESSLKKYLPLLLFILYLSIYAISGLLRSDHFYVAGLAMLLWYAGPRVKPLFHFLLPLLLVAIIYDSMRFYSDFLRGPIHVKEPYQFDLYFFGINTPTGRLTPNEWWQLHTYPLLDFITGFFYLCFISIYVLLSAYFCFWLPKKGTPTRSPAWISEQRYRPMWAFFFVNMLGYSTYYWYAAAPPWYVALYGLGPANLSVHANAAGAVRFDALFGTHFFTGWYGRSADVFGAIPSLHIAYPLQSVYYAHRYHAGRAFSWMFYLIMCFSAVYLNHHYILDLLWGSTYALLVCVSLDFFFLRVKIKKQSN